MPEGRLVAVEVLEAHMRTGAGHMEFLGAAVGALVGAMVAIISTRLQLRHQERRSARELNQQGQQWAADALARGLGFLGGGRQERSIGIGIIEMLIRTDQLPLGARSAVDNVLWGQLLYVAYEGDVARSHEHANAVRLIDLLSESPTRSTLPAYSDSRWQDIVRRVQGVTQPAAPLPRR
jgi:hypothetical protein